MTTVALDMVNQEKLDSAIKLYNNAIALAPHNVEAYYGKGFAYSSICIQKNEYCDSAIQYFIIANNLKQGYRHVNYNLGMCFLKIGNYDISMNYFNLAIRQDETNGELYFYRGYLKHKLGNSNEACDDFKLAKSFGYVIAEGLYSEICHN